MKRFICYWNTLKEADHFIGFLFNGLLYVAHDYMLEDSYIKGNKLYEPIRCTICGSVSESWRQL